MLILDLTIFNMKKLLSIFFLVVSTFSYGQTTISNPDFEDWYLYKSSYSFYAPTGWSDGSACASAGGPEVCEFYIKRITDAQSGQYAIAHFNVENGSNVDYLTFSNTGANFSVPAFTGRPTSFSFYYKYSTDDNQPMSIGVTLMTGTLDNPGFIGQGEYDFSTQVGAYTKVTQKITYFSSSSPTGIFINFDYSSTPATAFDTLKVDNLTLNYPTGVNDPSSLDEFNVTIINKQLISSLPMDNISLYDLTGSVITSVANTSSELDLSSMKSGMYLLKSEVNGIPVVKKIYVP
jgi:hypothetical protein